MTKLTSGHFFSHGLFGLQHGLGRHHTYLVASVLVHRSIHLDRGG